MRTPKVQPLRLVSGSFAGENLEHIQVEADYFAADTDGSYLD